MYSKIKTYDLVFQTASNLTDNKYSFEIDNGIWGGANQTDVNNIIIDSVHILGDINESGIEVQGEYRGDRGNLIFYNKASNSANEGMKTSLGLLQYKQNQNIYEDVSSVHNFPSLDKVTNFNFFKSGGKVLFCDENFYDNNLYIFKYSEKKKMNELSSFDTKGIDVTYFLPSISSELDDAEYFALTDWENIHIEKNTPYLSMFQYELRNWFETNGLLGDLNHDLWGETNSFNQFAMDDDGTSDGNSTEPVLTVDFNSDSNGRF